MTKIYGEFMWRFDAELMASNAFGTLARAELRCYVAFSQPTSDFASGPSVLYDVLERGEYTSSWEQE